jgi:hypothetical protein
VFRYSVPKPVARRLSVSSVAGGAKRGSGTEFKSSEAPPITLHVDTPELVSPFRCVLSVEVVLCGVCVAERWRRRRDIGFAAA